MKQGEPGRNTTVEPGPFDGRAGPLVAFRISETKGPFK